MSSNNKRIAKNTLLLYFRMLLTMGVSLFTVRVVLDTLGAIDYGLNNVVGGVVTMFGFVAGTMTAASERFFAFEIGRNDFAQLKKIFSITLTIYIIIAIAVLILAETIGLWFVTHKMNIPPDRMNAALWVYHFSILSFMMKLFTVPYNAAIVAHEKMNVYAYVSIVEVSLKLIIIYLLVIFPFDKLKTFAVLTFAVTTIVTLIYRSYSQKNFSECKYKFYWNSSIFKEIMSFSGWNLFGATAGVLNGQGINILLNIFFGPAVNAARAIAFQVNGTINQFVMNFMTATTPQITKTYAAGETKKMMKLVFQSSKFSYFMLFILSVPVYLEIEYIFSLWLKETPDYVVLFTRLSIIAVLIDSLSLSLTKSAQATGRIKNYQIVIGGFKILILPISYVFLKFGLPAETVFYIAIVHNFICLFLRLIMLRGLINLSVPDFTKTVLIPITLTSIISYIFPYLINLNLDFSFFRLALVCVVSFVSSVATIYLIGLTSEERIYLIGLFNKLKNKRTNAKPIEDFKKC